MIIEIKNFKGYVKWMVTSEIIFVDPLYVEELLEVMSTTDYSRF